MIRTNSHALGCLALAAVAMWLVVGQSSQVHAQTPQQRAEQTLQEQAAANDVSDVPAADNEKASINILQLVWQARWLMIPILAMSVVVVTIGIERTSSLRRQYVMPRDLVAELDLAAEDSTKVDTRRVLRACTDHPSTLATVIRETVRKVGRPAADLELAAQSIMQRESERLYRNVRTLNLAAAVTPLMGLLGTVWGMIEAFFATANLPVGANKAESLAEGIYFALVTTAAGLLVAIPAAMLAHWLEGRIQKLFLDMEELISQRLLPPLSRVDAGSIESVVAPPPVSAAPSPASVATRRPPSTPPSGTRQVAAK